MTSSTKIEKAVKFFGYLELAFSLLSVASGIFALVIVSQAVSDPRAPQPQTTSNNNVMVKDDRPKQILTYLGIIAIKLIYLTILFFISEACLAVFLLRSVHTRNMGHLRLWIIAASVYTVLYLTDFVSTIHAISLFEDMSITLGVFVKVPLLILVWRFYGQLSKNGNTFVNEI